MMFVEISPSFISATSVGADPTLFQRSRHQNSKLNMIGAALCEILMDASRQ